ncbi:hypothetical protein LBMAG21_09370 [Armatimonadota bacterium]|nr:hypothetical protein LBMAG21_09370 [Armatimonadota bacterium]
MGDKKSLLHWVRHAFRLWAIYARMDSLVIMRSLGTMAAWIISDTVLNVASILGMLLLAERFDGIGMWSKYQVLFLLGYGSLVDGLVTTFFGYNIAFISRRLGRGQFDHTLIQPQPILLSLMTEGFNPAFGLPTMLPGIALIVLALPHFALSLSAVWWLLFGVNLIASVAIVLAFQFAWGSLAFRAPRAAEELSSSSMQLIVQLKSFPLDGLGGLLAGSLIVALPVGCVAWLPCRALLGMSKGSLAFWHTPLLAVGFVIFATVMFWKGLKYYEQVGSQRYSNFGFRS